MGLVCFTRRILRITALSGLLLVASTAFSLELFEGNLGYDGDWLHVVDAPAMSSRVYWYALGDDVTYRVQCAADAAFSNLVLDESGILENYIEPDLGPGFYYFRVHETHSSGATGGWSSPGTLEVREDLQAPRVRFVSPLADQTYSPGERLLIQLEVADDTVLHMARFTIDGAYAGTIGLKSENHKVKPSFGEPRIALFEYEIPSRKKGSLSISAVVYDVTYKSAAASVVLHTQTSSSGKATGAGQKR